jgi:hypothetical protein
MQRQIVSAPPSQWSDLARWFGWCCIVVNGIDGWLLPFGPSTSSIQFNNNQQLHNSTAFIHYFTYDFMA